MKVLFIGAHVDDAFLGAGGAIAKHTENNDEVSIVTVSILYDGVDLFNEFLKAANELTDVGSKINNHHFKVREFFVERQKILDALVEIAKTKYDLVYTHCSKDIHQDHEVVHNEVKRAFKYTNILGWEMPWNQRIFIKNHFVELTEDQLKSKVATLLHCFKSQEHRLYMNADFIRGNATVNGIVCGKKYAEAFEVINWIA